MSGASACVGFHCVWVAQGLRWPCSPESITTEPETTQQSCRRTYGEGVAGTVKTGGGRPPAVLATGSGYRYLRVCVLSLAPFLMLLLPTWSWYWVWPRMLCAAERRRGVGHVFRLALHFTRFLCPEADFDPCLCFTCVVCVCVRARVCFSVSMSF